MPTPKQSFLCGIKAVLPILVGIIPFSLITGLFAADAGLSPAKAISMSYIVFAGAAQLATVDLINQNASPMVIILTAVIINLRFSMYSASLAPHFNGLPVTLRGLLAYLLTDQAYAVTIIAFNNERKKFKHYYYIGAATTLWLTWQVGTIVGVFVGTLVPTSWSLDFAVPLTFLALVFPTMTSRPALMAAIVAGVMILLTHTFPYNLGLFISSFSGVLVGFIVDRWSAKHV
jgi:branched chain amino acid efflux pump